MQCPIHLRNRDAYSLVPSVECLDGITTIVHSQFDGLVFIF